MYSSMNLPWFPPAASEQKEWDRESGGGGLEAKQQFLLCPGGMLSEGRRGSVGDLM